MYKSYELEMSYNAFSKSMTWIWDMDYVLITSFLLHVLPHHTFPLGKRFGFYNPNLYLSPFLSFKYFEEEGKESDS